MFSALAGTLWYLQFLFYGMGESKMGKYGFAAWSILMSSSIIFSNLWGIILKEWKGTSTKTKLTLVSGLFILILSTALIGYGSYLQQFD
jgi:L-rhamnose-H+ transport protein